MVRHYEQFINSDAVDNSLRDPSSSEGSLCLQCAKMGFQELIRLLSDAQLEDTVVNTVADMCEKALLQLELMPEKSGGTVEDEL